MDQVIIVHGCPLGEKSVLPKSKRWMNWLEQKLNTKGVHAVAPDMPTPWAPKYEEWKEKIEEYASTNDTILTYRSQL